MLKNFMALPAAMFVILAAVLIASTYTLYLPPNFAEGFLAGRASYFFSTPYGIGFYAHILGAPLALICGTLQLNQSLLRRFPRVHRILGRIMILSTLMLASPGGFIMAFGTNAGPSAVLCFLLMSLLTAWFAAMSWRMAVQRRFAAHRVWAWRCYLMLVSAVVLRVIDPVLREMGVPDLVSYRLSLWLSWVPSLVIFEFRCRVPRPQKTDVFRVT